MPIYEYHCNKCDHNFEKMIWQSTDQSKIECPACHSGAIERLISSFASFTASGNQESSRCCGAEDFCGSAERCEGPT